MMQPSSRLVGIVRHLLLATGAMLVLLPLLWAIRISFLPAEDVFSPQFHLLPSRWIGFENYARALTASPLLRFLVNGVVVCAAIILCQVLVAIPCAYILAKGRIVGLRLIWLAVLVGLVVPPAALALPLFIMAAQLGLIDTYAALILPWTISPLGIFLLRQAFLRVPDELIEAARLDGLGEVEILARILVPLITPAIGALIMISLVAHWNDLLWPSVVVTSGDKATPPFGVMLFQVQEIGSDYGPLLAGAIMIAAPLLLVFILTQRRFLDGLSWTGSK
ncbi:multiple sugar transport system permease protein [Enhydrobacter aerosaccus]|uniref:Multiple sugar transport system permease protein n=1 Tax=Enhydrobacter aerosaccus TaxID=225324 RepID=A0A1T4LTV4_9HYPH|nr:carbohydrate ABC transporter permease [Enhydrobacter aerosaccus]SJZ57968.1 multiple sugar transport system permease protein [Enhydrobacter aerosaccus]